MRKFFIGLWIIYIIYFIFDIYTLVFFIWSSLILKIMFYIYFSFSCIYFIYLTNILYGSLHFCKNISGEIFYIFSYLSILFWLYLLLIIYINSFIFEIYLYYCPYLYNDNNYSLHYKRRCELYNINKNSRYKYQYICSFNSSYFSIDNFIIKKIKSDNICVPATKVVEYNKIIVEFIYEYKTENKFYCSRKHLPKKYPFAKDKYCSEIIYYDMWLYFFLSLSKIIYHIILIAFLSMIENANIGYNLTNILIFINKRININIFGNNNNENNSTEDSENSNKKINENFVRKKTENIIIENKKEYTINQNIKKLGQNKKIINRNIINIFKVKVDVKKEKNIEDSNKNIDKSNNIILNIN